VDFTSLYPWVNKYGCYPIGYPTILADPSLETLYQREYFGLVKCKVVPPRGLPHPVLPLKFAGKLMFALCRTCMETNSKQCGHSVEERAFVGTWTTAEVYQALDIGYEVLFVSEVHHFDRSREGLFSCMCSMFILFSFFCLCALIAAPHHTHPLSPLSIVRGSEVRAMRISKSGIRLE
jgi:hypothetical protein